MHNGFQGEKKKINIKLKKLLLDYVKKKIELRSSEQTNKQSNDKHEKRKQEFYSQE